MIRLLSEETSVLCKFQITYLNLPILKFQMDLIHQAAKRGVAANKANIDHLNRALPQLVPPEGPLCRQGAHQHLERGPGELEALGEEQKLPLLGAVDKDWSLLQQYRLGICVALHRRHGFNW